MCAIIQGIMASLDDLNPVTIILGDSSGLELMFSAFALVGGFLFLIWFILLLLGGVAEGVLEGVFGMEGFDAMSADGSFNALTFQGLMAFCMFFGLAGLYTLEVDPAGDSTKALSVLVGGIAGTASMYGTGKIFQVFFALEASGNVDISEAVGTSGTVYLRIPEGGVGQIQIELGGALKTYNAKSEDGQGIATGEFIQVVDNVASTMVVKRSSNSEE